jgi:alpha-ketoglutarate-dependent taurine dioxygenase
MHHAFTDRIIHILKEHFGEDLAQIVFDSSPLLQYLNEKTRSANRGSKARGAFANHYALYVLVEDYIKKGYFDERRGEYDKYEGARFSDLFRRQRELPFGAKLQNHALNSRLNEEFARFFPTLDTRPIIRHPETQRYWVNEELLVVRVTKDGQERLINIAKAVIDIIDAYVETKKAAFQSFLEACRKMAELSEGEGDTQGAIAFVHAQLQPNVDARIFEIVSYAILKAHYGEQSIFWGWSREALKQEYLALFKTGRTNANDGGIDFVMKPLGRFFQVTETIDVNKYFLDIDKIQRYPLTFVVKTNDDADVVKQRLMEQARRKYRVTAIVERYVAAIEEIINIPFLLAVFESVVRSGKLPDVMAEIVRQSRVEFNYEDDDDDDQITEDENPL